MYFPGISAFFGRGTLDASADFISPLWVVISV